VLRRPDAPKLVVLDWMMPEMDGIEVCHRLRAVETDLPPYILLLTARDRKEDIVVGLDAGANDYLAKPYNPEELRARLGVGRRIVEIQAQLAEKIKELRDALNHIKTLRGIVPICAWCKKVRDDEGYWERVEHYVSKHSYAKFSHGLCPECLKKQIDGLEVGQHEPP
jgi:CheY-like chemotaxis protein